MMKIWYLGKICAITDNKHLIKHSGTFQIFRGQIIFGGMIFLGAVTISVSGNFHLGGPPPKTPRGEHCMHIIAIIKPKGFVIPCLN